MNKEESLEIKGIALIMMLWCHFYLKGNQYDLYYLFEFKNFNLFKFLNNACTPVVFFVFLSGYGLYYVYEKGDQHRYSRILKLFIHYWVITIIFTIIAHFLANKEKYPGDFIDIIFNLTAFKTTWNHECWFLFPYSILALSYPNIFNFIKKHDILGGGISLSLFFTSGYIISKYGTGGSLSNPLLNNTAQLSFMLFPFVLGALSAHYDFFRNLRKKYSQKRIRLFSSIFFFLIVIIKCFISSAVVNPIYAFIFITLYLLTERSWISPLFKFVGKHSMNLWMIHTWLMVYIFSDFFYSLKNPILILATVLIIGILISMIINLFIGQLFSSLNKH